ncbi:MAG: manganese efflux pump [Bacteroidales bacterium]|nr:manganese efflux pump [Bacteroidales bacterium]
MVFWEAFLLALALCVDTLVVSAATALRLCLLRRQRLLMALVFALCQGAFPLAGALIGDAARAFIEAVDHWIAFALLALVGGKMLLDGIRDREEALQTFNFRFPIFNYLLLGVATSIDAFAVGIGLGLQHPLGTVLWVVLLIALTTFVVSLLGSALGRRRTPIPGRTANVVAGVVLVALGVKILLEHLFF